MTTIRSNRRRLSLSVLAFLVVVTLSACETLRPTGLDDAIDDYFRGRVEHGFAGTVAISRGTEMIFLEAYGFAAEELGVPNRPATVYRIGSLTKPLVGAAVMALVEEGSLDTGDSICSFLANCPESWEGVTIHHLLQHTSGIPDHFGDLPAAPPEELRRVIDDFIATGDARPPDSPPGSSYSYSNFGYLLLGYALENASGKSWLEVLDQQVWSPSRMSGTDYDRVWELVPDRARGYDERDGAISHVPYKDHGAFTAGGLRSTAEDMLRFAISYGQGRVVSDQVRAQSLEPGPGGYGYGWQVGSLFGRSAYNHTGGTTGFASHLVVYPDEDLTIVVLSNYEHEPAKATACDLASILFGLDYPRLDELGSLDGAESFTGVYVDREGVIREIVLTESSLVLRRGESELHLDPVESYVYRLRARPDILLRFSDDEDQTKLRAISCGEELFSATRRP